jgi:hypothetical protein
MTGLFLAMPAPRAVDSGGAPLPGALLQFFLTGTTTPASVYASAALTTPLSNPVVADAGGLFPPIYLDPSAACRCQLLTSGGVVVRDIDPVSTTIVEATSAQVNAGAASGVYVSPVALATWTGVPAALGYTPANRAGDTLTNAVLAFSSLQAGSAGYLGLPLNEQDMGYATTLQDAGKMVRANSASPIAYTLTPLATVAYPVGTAITFRNAGAGVVTLTPGAGVTLIKAGATTPSASLALAQGALCTAVMEAANSWVVSGVGMT